jgi:2-amino-4-hydroxy-6-hydroxymethyldihydropteridine diphosphokinase
MFLSRCTEGEVSEARGVALVALGSNLQQPLFQLRRAARRLSSLGTLLACSSLYRTTSVGGPPGQPDYFNAVVALRPRQGLLQPECLLVALHEIEKSHGRVRRIRWAPRPLDLDLLSLDDLVVEGPTLWLPHPRMMQRAFVLAPLCEIAGSWCHPVTKQSACEALVELSLEGVRRTSLLWQPS